MIDRMELTGVAAAQMANSLAWAWGHESIGAMASAYAWFIYPDIKSFKRTHLFHADSRKGTARLA